MRISPIALSFLAALAQLAPSMAQERLADLLADPTTQLQRPADRERVVARMRNLDKTRRQNALAKAARLGFPVRSALPNGRLREIADFQGDTPVYFTTDNAGAAISTGADLLRVPPYSLTGSGVTIGLWDGGTARATHQEFGGRMIVKDTTAPSEDHATHVGGTLIASGVVVAAHGMAGAATVDSYDWDSDMTEMTARGATNAGEAGKIYLSNHSYGFVSGWDYVNDGTRVWQWNGTGTSASGVDDDFGKYNNHARDCDALAYNAPYYLIFQGAGNDRTDNPAPGEWVSLSPATNAAVASYDPASHPKGDGSYRGGFDTISDNAIAKNVITIGSASDAVTGGMRDATKAVCSSFSSWGPTDDGRIKPDVVANGEGVYSSLNGSDQAYGSYSGTSMATPNATGSAALLIEQYQSLFPGQAMRSSTLKGLLIHTADDRGNPGPDYQYGWGLINVKAAADVIRDHFDFPLKQHITEDQLSTSIITRTHSFVWDGVSPISATLCWTDPAGTGIATSDFRTARLVNNLNLKLIAPNGAEILPYVMPFVGTWTQASMDLPATTGVNKTDNVEQVRIGAASAGTYQVVVSSSGALTNSLQKYSLLISGAAAITPPLKLAAISPNNGYGTTVTCEIAGFGLRTDTIVKLTRPGHGDVTATGVQMVGETLRCQINLSTASAGTWDVVAINPDSETFTITNGFTLNPSLWSENFDGPVTGWASQAVTGSNTWSLVGTQSKSPGTSYFAAGPNSRTTTRLTSPVIPVPPGVTDLKLKFWHNYNLRASSDGGRLEFSTDGGTTWFDIEAAGSGASFASNGYNSTNTSTSNDFGGLRTWSGNSGAFIETVIDLTDTAKYAGKNFRMRWCIATNSSTSSTGWYVDSIVLLGGVGITNQPPAITAAATTDSTEIVEDPDGSLHQIIQATSADLSVTATDDTGESFLTYTWAVKSGPSHPVTFTENATHAAKSTHVHFNGSGDYELSVTVLDKQGLATTSIVNVRVIQMASALIVDPPTSSLLVGDQQVFHAALLDQFSFTMEGPPVIFIWSTDGGGTITSEGHFTATTAGSPFKITAASGDFSNTASIVISPAPAVLDLANLNQTYDGDPKAVTFTTTPPGLEVAIHYDGSPQIPTGAGNYIVTATIMDRNYEGSATATLEIGKARATITLSDLEQTHDGLPKPVGITTSPAGLTTSVSYNDTSAAPSEVGTYTVVATVTDPNHEGSTSGLLAISYDNDYAAWQENHFTLTEKAFDLSADGADPDSDGLPNLAEYALGTDPLLFTAPLAGVPDAEGFSLIFTRPANLPGITYVAESSEDLITWTPVPLEVITPGGTETLRARATLIPNDKPCFLRLRFTRE